MNILLFTVLLYSPLPVCLKLTRYLIPNPPCLDLNPPVIAAEVFHYLPFQGLIAKHYGKHVIHFSHLNCEGIKNPICQRRLNSFTSTSISTRFATTSRR